MTSLSVLDFGLLITESKSSPRHVAGLQVFDLPKGAPPDFVYQLVADWRAQQPVPPFSWKLQLSRFAPPKWVEDSDFDIDRHLFHRALPWPGSIEQLIEAVAALHAPLLDRELPLWEVSVFEGLEGGRFAVYAKIHHAYMDGMTLTRRSMQSLAQKPNDFTVPVIWADHRRAEKHARERKSQIDSLLKAVKRFGTIARLVPELSGMAARHGLRLMQRNEGSVPVPFSAPRSLFNRPITPERSLGICSLSLSQARAIARRENVTINDVILTICDVALREYLDIRHEKLERPLVVEMPISLRSEEDVGQSGNHVAMAFVKLANDQSDPRKRLHQVHRNAHDAKREARAVSAQAAEVYLLLPQILAQTVDDYGAAEYFPPIGNVVISSVIADAKPRYLRGARLRATYPISTIAPNTAMNITLLTHDGRIHFGLIAGRKVIPDPQTIADDIVSAFGSLDAASRRAQKTARAASNRKKKARSSDASRKRKSRKSA